ncbi:Maf-like protein [Actinomycetospora endophytica]|uniref:Nucleoside triphosphate pyrophosphatase n=1 Tax=Actinomycetospora endophytica TaxID=2291215 RepID=A0ABS8PJ44_9PSEU|nr:nucleoside triphosphate pyrophosphatase [Actinomycetospora endophytica]MCD2197411.1 Maf-like protein [Actinomycetospora endophytica]
MHLVLASASPARLGVLRSAGVEPTVLVSDVDEESLLAALGDASPAEKVTGLAMAKARSVAGRVAAEVDGGFDGVVIGCDSMLDLDGELVGKPGTTEAARARWQQIAGGHGELVTGHAVIRLRGGLPESEISGHAATMVTFGSPTELELEAYLASGEPLAVAGAFTLDGLGGWFVEGIQGDPANVVGISLPLTRHLLAELGVAISDLWATAARGGPAAG